MGALKAKMGVGKPKRRPQHNVSVTRAPPYKVLQRNLNPPLKQNGGKPKRQAKCHTRGGRVVPPMLQSMVRNLSPFKQNGGKRASPSRQQSVTHAAAGLLPQYKCWNTDLNNRPKEKRRKKNGATQTTKVVA